jgi:hypothetical protein
MRKHCVWFGRLPHAELVAMGVHYMLLLTGAASD